jgi:malate/lactate dehydrogenase
MTVMNIVSYEYSYLDTHLEAAMARVADAEAAVAESNRRLDVAEAEQEEALDAEVALINQICVVRNLEEDNLSFLTKNAGVLEIAIQAAKKAAQRFHAEKRSVAAAVERRAKAEAVLGLRQAELRLLQLADVAIRG